MAGLLDDFMNTPAGIGLLSAVAGGLAGARKGTPYNNVGRAGIAGLVGYQGEKDNQRQLANTAIADKYRTMQMNEIEQRLAQQQAQQKWKAGLPAVMTPKLTGSTDQGQMLAEQNAAFGQEGLPALAESAQYAQPDAPLNMNYGVDQQAMQQYMMQPDSPYAEKIMERQLFPEKQDMQLVTVYDEQQRPVQKWVAKGQSDGVTVGYGKVDSSPLGSLIAERNTLPEGHPARRLYDQAIEKAATHAPAAQLNNYGSPVAGVGPDGQPVFFQPDKAGGAPSIVPGVAPAPPKPTPPTGEENTAAGYLGRMTAAERLINKLDGGQSTVGTSLAGAVPFIGDYTQRKVMSPTQQQYKQAADDWIRAKLRKESGAVIADTEMLREYQTYFPQPGDEPETIKQKAMARRQAEEQMIQSAGRAAPVQTQVPLSNSENNYIAKRRASGATDQEIALELQQGAANAKKQPAKKKPIPMKAPPGVDANVWQYMTPQERKLWIK